MTTAANIDIAWPLALKVSSPGNNDDNRAAFLGALIATRCPTFSSGNVTHIVNALQRLAGSVQRLAVQDCNHGLTVAQQKTMQAKKAAFRELANACGFDAQMGGDPRGHCCKLFAPGLVSSGDGWGGGWAVYK